MFSGLFLLLNWSGLMLVPIFFRLNTYYVKCQYINNRVLPVWRSDVWLSNQLLQHFCSLILLNTRLMSFARTVPLNLSSKHQHYLTSNVTFHQLGWIVTTAFYSLLNDARCEIVIKMRKKKEWKTENRKVTRVWSLRQILLMSICPGRISSNILHKFFPQ